MDCSVIFYSARKTSFCEKALRKCLAPLHLRISTACFANGARQLGERLIEAFSSNEICVVVGGNARKRCVTDFVVVDAFVGKVEPADQLLARERA